MKNVVVSTNQQNALLNDSIMVVKDAANFDLNNFVANRENQLRADVLPPSPPSTSDSSDGESGQNCLSALVQSSLHPSVLLKHTMEVKLTSGEPEEDAFFIADLGEITRQYRRWMHLLPRIEPFYGKLFCRRILPFNPSKPISIMKRLNVALIPWSCKP